MNTPEPLPCPFCESEEIHSARHMQVASTNFRYVACRRCGAHGPVGNGDVEAITLWNRRPVTAKPTGATP